MKEGQKSFKRKCKVSVQRQLELQLNHHQHSDYKKPSSSSYMTKSRFTTLNFPARTWLPPDIRTGCDSKLDNRRDESRSITCHDDGHSGDGVLIVHSRQLDVGGVISNVHEGSIHHLVVDSVLGGTTHTSSTCKHTNNIVSSYRVCCVIAFSVCQSVCSTFLMTIFLTDQLIE
jgi:hypothetical protein